MQDAIRAAVVAFVILLASLTITVIAEHGFDVLTVLSVLILAVIGFGVLGALFSKPPHD
jgi:hypothetical protein